MNHNPAEQMQFEIPWRVIKRKGEESGEVLKVGGEGGKNSFPVDNRMRSFPMDTFVREESEGPTWGGYESNFRGAGILMS